MLNNNLLTVFWYKLGHNSVVYHSSTNLLLKEELITTCFIVKQNVQNLNFWVLIGDVQSTNHLLNNFIEYIDWFIQASNTGTSRLAKSHAKCVA